MAEAKTKKTTQSPAAFIAAVPDQGMRRDCATLVRLMKKVTGEPAAMWGPAIVGFGTYPLRYASGRTAEWPVAAFSPRKRDLTMYVLNGFDGEAEMLRQLGPHTTGKVCLYVKSLSDVDLGVLEKIVTASVAHVRKRYPTATAAAAVKKTAKKAVPKAAPKAAVAKRAKKA